VDTKKLAGVVAATAVMFSIGAAPPASATNVQVVGIEERLQDPNGTEIAYTVTKILPSADPVAYPVIGQLYEATVEARAIRGTVVPVVPFFNARAESGVNYRVLAEVSSLSGAPLAQGGVTDGKIYFDAVGDAPNSVVYNNGFEDLLAWVPAGQPVPGGSTDGGGSDSSGGDQGVTGSTGPNDVSPETSGGEAGNTGEDGVEGGGGNLETGGGSGATDADTGS
jgi:hypothetical protein